MRRLLLLVTLIALAAPAAGADAGFSLGASAPGPAAFAPLRRAGVRAVKIIADWSALEPAAGRFRWTELDAAVAAARREGLQPAVVLTYTPGWASLASGQDARDPLVATRTPPRRLADWERFVTEAVRRHRGAVKEWQVWTIPALPHFRGTALEYLALVRAARRASAAADPTSRVVASSPPGFDLVHVQRALTQAPEAVSVVSLAPATLGPEQWLRPLAALRQRVLSRGDRPLWVEWGPDRSTPLPAAVVRATAVARAAGVERLFITADLTQLEDSARAALAALEALPFTGYLIRDPGTYALVFGSGERAALLAWRTEGSAPLEIPVLPAVRVLALDGRAAPSVLDGRAAVTLGPAPVFIAGAAPAVVEEAKGTLQQRGPLLPSLPPERDFSQAPEVGVRLGRAATERGLYQVLRGRAGGEAVQVAGEEALQIPPGRDAAFVYFDVDDTFLFFNDGRYDVIVSVEVWGAQAAQSAGFNLFYDARTGYRFTSWQWVEVGEAWITYTFRLEDANFATTAGWDFAINPGATRGAALTVRAVTVRKVAR